MKINICNACGDVPNSDYAVDAHGIVYCKLCADVHSVDDVRTHKHTCFWCGELIHNDDVVDCGKRKYHTDCLDNNAHTVCDSCRVETHDDNLHYVALSEHIQFVCADCLDNLD